MMIAQFSDSPSVNWTLLVVKHLKKPESRARFPAQAAANSLLQLQEWRRRRRKTADDLPCMKSYTGFFFPDHVLTYTQSLQLGWVPTWAASISKKKKEKKKRFQCCQRCMMGKAREEIRRDKQMRWCSWCSWCSVPSATHLMVWTGKQCLISQLIDAALTL